MDPYATPEQLTAWLPAATAELDEEEAIRLLTRASSLVDRVVRVPYDVDDDGIPTDADVAQVLADAVCAQVEQWLEVGEENDVDGRAGTQVSAQGFTGQRAPRLAPRTADALLSAGLLRVPGWSEVAR